MPDLCARLSYADHVLLQSIWFKVVEKNMANHMPRTSDTAMLKLTCFDPIFLILLGWFPHKLFVTQQGHVSDTLVHWEK
jgi:hypothetical protein